MSIVDRVIIDDCKLIFAAVLALSLLQLPLFRRDFRGGEWPLG